MEASPPCLKVKVLSATYLATPLPELATAKADYSLVQAALAESQAKQVAVISAITEALEDHSLAVHLRSPAAQTTSDPVTIETGRVSLNLLLEPSLVRVVAQVLVPQVHSTELAGRFPERPNSKAAVLSSQITC